MFIARYVFSVASFSYLIVCILVADHGTHGRELRNKGSPLEGTQEELGGPGERGGSVVIWKDSGDLRPVFGPQPYVTYSGQRPLRSLTSPTVSIPDELPTDNTQSGAEGYPGLPNVKSGVYPAV